jgi:hypothetical protein
MLKGLVNYVIVQLHEKGTALKYCVVSRCTMKDEMVLVFWLCDFWV